MNIPMVKELINDIEEEQKSLEDVLITVRVFKTAMDNPEIISTGALITARRLMFAELERHDQRFNS